MDIYSVFEKWKLNRNLFSSLVGMHKSTFNTKLDPNKPSSFSPEELNNLKSKIDEMAQDLKKINFPYPIQEEDLTGNIDEEITYNNKII